MIEFFMQRIDDIGIVILVPLGIIWNVRRSMRMTRHTPLADRLPLVLATMGLVGILASWVKLVDTGRWPIFLYLLGTVSWNGMPNIREIVARRFAEARFPTRFLRHVVGIRE